MADLNADSGSVTNTKEVMETIKEKSMNTYDEMTTLDIEETPKTLR